MPQEQARAPLIENRVRHVSPIIRDLNSNWTIIALYFILVTMCFIFAFTNNAMAGKFDLNWNIRTANYVYVFYGALYFIGIYGILSQFKWFHEAMRKNVWSNKYYMKFMPKSWNDLVFSLLLLFLNLYWIIYVTTSFTRYSKLTPLTVICLLCAPYLNLLWALSVLLCTRNTIWSTLTHMPHVYELPYHRFIGLWTYFITIVHFMAIFIQWAIDGDWGNFIHIGKFQSFDWGTATQLYIYIVPLILLVFITSLHWIRRLSWEWFYFPHAPVAIICVILTLIHSRDSYRYLSVGMVLYVFDRLRRYFMRLLVRYSIVEITADNDIIRLDMKQRGPVYMPLPKPGHVFEYHPFTVARIEGEHVILHIKPMKKPKSWTHKLYTAIENKTVTNNSSIFVEGNYGETFDIDNESHLVYVGAGVGFAGLSASLLNVIKRYENNELPNLKSIDVFLTVIDDEHLYWYKKEFEILKKCKLVHLHTNITFSKFPEKKQSVYNNQPEGEYTLSTDPENPLTIPFSVGRVNVSEAFKSFDRNERYVFFTCCPLPLYDDLSAYVYTHLKKSGIYADPFDM